VSGESIRELLRGIMMDVRTLVREEIALARVEIREQVGRARAAAVSFAITIVALACGGLLLLVALSIGIADLFDWPVWSGFLVVALLLCLIGFITLSVGRRRLAEVHAVPSETVSTLKENSEWIAKRLSSVRR
jgi:MFS family permease